MNIFRVKEKTKKSNLAGEEFFLYFVVSEEKRIIIMHQSWRLYLKRGKSFLSQHDPRSAVGCFEKALHHCPVEESCNLASILYLCGIALSKLGQAESAKECWHSAVSLQPESPASSILQYRSTSEEYEWHLFKTMQLSGYFDFKQQAAFYSEEERRKVTHIIYIYWEELQSSGLLAGLNKIERMQLFAEVSIDFDEIFCGSAYPEFTNIVPIKGCRKDPDTLNS